MNSLKEIKKITISWVWMESVFNKFRFVDDHKYIHTSYNNSCNYQLGEENLEEIEQPDGVFFAPEKISPKARWKKAMNMIAVEKWKAKLEEIEKLAAAKLSELPEIATLSRKTFLFVSAIA